MDNSELIGLIDQLRALPKENEWVEFKSGSSIENDKFGQYISAISNAACINKQPFGYLVFGVNDLSHNVEGTNFKFKNRKEGNEEFEPWLRKLLSPSVNFHFYPFFYNNLYLEIFKIPAAIGEPTLFKKVPYIRFDSSVTDLRNYPSYLRTIYNSHEDWSAKIINGATLNDLDSEAINLARTKYKEKQIDKAYYNEIDHWSNELFLDKAKITIGGKITNTAIILLGKSQSAHYISPSVAQITWKLETEERAYEHFEIPLFTSVNDVLKRIRNTKYKFFPNNQLIATEVLKYDPEVILEALNNCIAHQDYSLFSRIILTEQTGKLTFSSAGGFFEGKAEDYTFGDKTPKVYRNRWLADAMVSLNMIDSMGYGIYKMFKSQKQRFFPLPDYSKSNSSEVILDIYGHSIDENYSKLLIERKDDLSLSEVILLDKVQKAMDITDDAAKILKKKGYIEGRKPHFHISSSIASVTGQELAYLKAKGIEDDYCKKLIKDYIFKFKGGLRSDFEKLLDDKLPDLLTQIQKKDKVKNLLQAMKRADEIYLDQKIWRLKDGKI